MDEKNILTSANRFLPPAITLNSCMTTSTTSNPQARMQAPAGLLLAEDVLRRLKAATADTPLWEDSAVNTNEMLQAGTPLCDIKLAADQLSSADTSKKSKAMKLDGLFLEKHWRCALGEKAEGTAFFVARKAEPRYLKLRTFSRLGYLQALPRIAHALEGLDIDLYEDRSWTWDHKHLTPAGRPTDRTIFLLTIALNEGRPFNADRWLKSAAPHLCVSLDERADHCVFQMLENAKLPRGLANGYQTTPDGFVIDCRDTESATKIAEALFQDCQCNVSVLSGRASKQVQLEVTLP